MAAALVHGGRDLLGMLLAINSLRRDEFAAAFKFRALIIIGVVLTAVAFLSSMRAKV